MIELLIGTASNLLIVAMALTWTWRVNERHASERSDLLDRLQEMVGTIHHYQVVGNASRIPDLSGAAPSPGVAGGAGLFTPEAEDDAFAMARRADGTLDQARLNDLLGEFRFQDSEIALAE